MKLVKLMICYVVFCTYANAQEVYSSIKINIIDSSEKIIESREFENWKEVLADTTLNNLKYNIIIRDKKGDLVKPKLENLIIRSISKNPKTKNILYLGIKGNTDGDGKVAMSMDYGNSWTYMNRGKPLSKESEDVQTIESSPHDANLIYAGTWKNGLYKSSDSGNTFKKVENFPSKDIRAIIFHPKNNHQILVATTSHGIVETQNNGETWEFKDIEYLKSNFRSLWNLVQSPYNPNVLYALSIGQGLHKSLDFGKNWKKVIDDSKMIIFGFEFRNEREIWCSSTDFQSGKLYYSKDSGNNFELRENQIDDIIGCFVSASKTQFYLGGQKGLYTLSDNEIQNSKIVLPFYEISNLIEVNDKLLIATWGNGLIITEK
mgnify:CR=1 FL=1